MAVLLYCCNLKTALWQYWHCAAMSPAENGKKAKILIAALALCRNGAAIRIAALWQYCNEPTREHLLNNLLS